jgi:predicted RNase H-like HicB family nuclease
MAKSVRLNGDRRFTIALRPEKEGGYSVQCLELPQAISQGETKTEALANIRDAIALVLEHLKAKERARKAELIEIAV